MGKRRALNDPSVRVELTERQEEVLRRIAKGRTNGQIAEELGLSLDGVKWHVREILQRLGADSREQAAEWWKRERGLRDRLPGWLGWPLAAGFGGASAAAVAVVVIVAMVAGGAGEPEPLSQPELTLAGEGDGWELYIDEDGELPHARDAALAVWWEGDRTEVGLVDARTGRVAAKWHVGYSPMAVLRPSENQLVVSDRVDWLGRSYQRVLVFDLDAPTDPVTSERLGDHRLEYTAFANGLVLSNDGRFLYYVIQNYPPEARVPAGSARYGIRALDLDRMADAQLKVSYPGDWPALIPYRESGVVVQHDFQDAFVADAADDMNAEPRPAPDDAPTGGWEVVTPHVADDVVLRARRGRGGIESTMNVQVMLVRREDGATVAMHRFDDLNSIASMGGREALLLMAHGSLRRFDVWTGESETLPYSFGDAAADRSVELVR